MYEENTTIPLEQTLGNSGEEKLTPYHKASCLPVIFCVTRKLI